MIELCFFLFFSTNWLLPLSLMENEIKSVHESVSSEFLQAGKVTRGRSAYNYRRISFPLLLHYLVNDELSFKMS